MMFGETGGVTGCLEMVQRATPAKTRTWYRIARVQVMGDPATGFGMVNGHFDIFSKPHDTYVCAGKLNTLHQS